MSRVYVARGMTRSLDKNFFIQYLLCISLLKKEILHVCNVYIFKNYNFNKTINFIYNECCNVYNNKNIKDNFI